MNETIFISYSKGDREIAKKLYLDLKKFGFEPWLDTEHLLPGQNWKEAIIRAIEDSSYFFALISPNSLSNRGFVQKELKIALEYIDEFPESDIYLIPIRLADCKMSDSKLRNIHWVDFFPLYYEGFIKILHALKADLDDYQKLQLENELLKEKLAKSNNENKISNYFVQPDDQVIEEIKCEGILVDSYLAGSEQWENMPEERAWKYELEDVVIKIYPNEISLEYVANVKHPGDVAIEVYKSYGKGLFTGEKGFIIYKYEEIRKGFPNWEGMMLLRVPRRGRIYGFWMTTGVNRDDKFPIGRIELRRKI